jgi:hypothetical protein
LGEKNKDIIAYNYGFDAKAEMSFPLSPWTKIKLYARKLPFFCVIIAALLLGADKSKLEHLYIIDKRDEKEELLK